MNPSVNPDMNPDVQPALLPRDPQSGEPLAPADSPGYYPGYSTMSQKAYWDKATRDLVSARLEPPGPLQHFSADQARFWRAVFDHVLPQFDRPAHRRIPIVEPLDRRLHLNHGDGYRFADMPRDSEAYRLGEQAISEEARAQFNGEFVDLPHRQQDLVLKALHDGKPTAARIIWKQMSIRRFWQLLVYDAIEAYYAHPWAWDEIGFGGPAYPRAYTRLERGEPEPWEVEEQRSEWLAPPYTISDISESTHSLHTESDQNNFFLERRR